MPIVAKRELEARRAAREVEQNAREQVPPAPSVLEPPPSEPPGPVEQVNVPAAAGRAGKAKRPRKEKRPKKQPRGDYETGYCRPPVGHRLDGGKPGPGRPRGAVSQDTLLKKHLTETHSVARNGRQTKAQTREVILMLKVKAALSGDRRAQNDLLAEAARLFAERQEVAGFTPEPADLDEHDRAMLEALRDTMFPRTGQDNDPNRGECDEAGDDEFAGERS